MWYNVDMTMDVHFSSQTDLWSTPRDFFARVDAEFHFSLDVCAVAENALCPRYYSPEENGLSQPWTGRCWMNPPYGREIGRWVERAFYAGSWLGTAEVVVCLLPARTDTRWWWNYVRFGEVRFIPGRLKFGGQKNAAPFPSALVVFGAGWGPETVYI